MPGPAPKPASTRQRRNATVAMTALPSGGRKGKAPAWPLIEDLSLVVKRSQLMGKAEELQGQLEDTDSIKTQKKLQREMQTALDQAQLIDRQIDAQKTLEVELWRDLWATPQAEMWDKLAWHRDVAQYVRWKVLAEMGNIEAAKEARMWSDRLGLNPLAMLRLRWEIERVDEAQERGTARRTRAKTAEQQKVSAEDPRKGLYAV
jgi:hypothetical protein